MANRESSLWPLCLLAMLGSGGAALSCRADTPQDETEGASGGGPLETSSASPDASSGSAESGETCPENTNDGDLNVVPEADLGTMGTITKVLGDLTIARLEDAEDLSMLQCLRRVEGKIILWNNTSLSSLYGLSRLEHVGEGLALESNGKITSLAGLDSLRELPALALRNNPSLKRLDINNIESIEYLEIGYCFGGGPEPDADLGGLGNPSLKNLAGLDALKSVDTLRIEWNESLETLDGLHTIADNNGTVGRVLIRHNKKLPTANIEATISLLGAEGTICGNLGDEDPTSCPCDPAFP